MPEQFGILECIDRAKAAARRDEGIERVSRKAGHDWNEAALDRLRQFIAGRVDPFLAEDVVYYAEAVGFRKPHDARAWGAVMQSAARRGLIVRIGYAKAKTSNLSPKVLWQRRF